MQVDPWYLHKINKNVTCYYQPPSEKQLFWADEYFADNKKSGKKLA